MEFFPMFTKAAELYGLPFALFIGLLVWVLWKNDQREARYLDVIKTLSDDVKERLTKIETRLFQKGDER